MLNKKLPPDRMLEVQNRTVQLKDELNKRTEMQNANNYYLLGLIRRTEMYLVVLAAYSTIITAYLIWRF